MKKMILAAAIVCAATIVNAAACQWSLTGIKDSPSTAVGKDTMVAYFMDGATYDEFAALDSSKAAAYASSKALATANTVVSRTGAQAGGSFGNYAVGEKVSGYMVIFDNADASSAEYYAYTPAQTFSVPSAGNVQFASGFDTTTGWTSTASTPTPPGPTPDVPEPTSGLLLVLGGAALALRRRR